MAGITWSKAEESMLQEALKEELPYRTKTEAIKAIQAFLPSRSHDSINKKADQMGLEIRVRGQEVNRQAFEEFLKLRRPV